VYRVTLESKFGDKKKRTVKYHLIKVMDQGKTRALRGVVYIIKITRTEIKRNLRKEVHSGPYQTDMVSHLS